tara:strand:- start:221 stop:454 length:234 start_codon:yes stop_codon:yes gene_type:complete
MNIKIYGADWCSDCIHAKDFLNSREIPFEYIIITDNNDALAFIEKVNNGKRIIPTIDVDGQIYANPGIDGLTKIITE